MAQTKVKLISDGVIVQGNLHASHGITTAHIGEGSNLYYTDARVGSYLSTNSFATESYVGTQIANLVDSSPSALNTLNELAAALGDDANFSTTVTNSIALKAPLASPSFTGNVGIGVTTPVEKLHIRDASTDADVYIKIANDSRDWFMGVLGSNSDILSFKTHDASNLLNITSAGNVGIGTTTLTNSSGYNTLSISGSSGGQIAFQTSGAGKHFIYSTATDLAFYNGQAGNLIFYTDGSNERMRIDSSGNVFINGQTNNILGTNTSDGADNKSITVTSSSVPSSNRGGYASFYGNEHGTFAGNTFVVAGNTSGAELRLNAVNSSGIVTAYTANSERMRIDSSGNVGIGVTGPLSPLTVKANVGGSALRFIGRSADNISGIDFFNSAQTAQNYFQSNSSWMRVRADGGFHFSKGSTPITTDVDGFTIEGMNVGIGTVTPNGKLEVSSNSSLSSYVTQYTNDADGAELVIRTARGTQSSPVRYNTNDSAGRLLFQAYTSSGVFKDAASIESIMESCCANAYGGLRFNYMPAAAPYTLTEGMSIKMNGDVLIPGNVGIGTTTPDYELDVNGSIRAGRVTTNVHYYATTNSASNQYFHIKTSVNANSQICMHTWSVEGYAYGSPAIIDCKLAFHTDASGGIYGKSYLGSLANNIYKSTDNYVVLVFGTVNTYYTHFYTNLFEGMYTPLNSTVLAVAYSPNNSGVY